MKSWMCRVVKTTGALLAASIAVMTAGSSSAHAAELEAVTNVRIVQPADTVDVGDAVDIEALWTLNNAMAGDSFSLGLPEEIQGLPATFPMHNTAGDVIGECEVKPTMVTCTVSDFVEQFESISGTLTFWSRAVKSSTSDSVAFSNGDLSLVVPLPGGGINPGEVFPFPKKPFKHGQISDDVENSSEWSIYVPGRTILASSGDPYVITDVHHPGLSLDESSVKIYFVTEAQWLGPHRWNFNQFMKPADFKLQNVTTDTFQIALNRAAIDPHTLYIIQYDMAITADITDGTELLNTATGAGVNVNAAVIRQGGGAEAEGNSTPRTISLTKHVQGKAPAGVSYGFSLNCVDAQSQQLPGFPRSVELRADETVELTDIAINSSCELTEVQSHGGVPKFNVPASFELTRTSPAVIEIVATNVFPVADPGIEPSNAAWYRLPLTGSTMGWLIGSAGTLLLLGLIVFLSRRKFGSR